MILRYKLESAYMQLCTLHQWPDCIVACRELCRQDDVKEFAHEYNLDVIVNNAIPANQFYLMNMVAIPKYSGRTVKIV